ncbi:MAG: FtsQ-type POTRA domain-containing protein [Deltaproteobacteria bacterium]|nr:FtsQ-type POTRA domain-containing protein [Deltaproteobacteria bacterium]
MKKPFRLQLEAKKNRLKRHAGEFLREVGQVILLMGAIVCVTALLLIAYDVTVRSPYLCVREVFVKGCKELTEKEILALAAIRPTPNILTLNLDAIVRRIQVNPWIREVSVGREFPNRLVIVVRERKAVALLQGEGELHLLDGDGSLFKKLEPGDETNLPVLTGCLREGKADEALIKKSLVLLGTLAGAKDVPAIGSVSEVHGNETFGLSVFTDTGLCLQLGFDGYEGKLQRLAPVMADLDRKNLKTGFLLIDLSDPAKINVQQRSVLTPGGSAEPAAGTGQGYRM